LWYNVGICDIGVLYSAIKREGGIFTMGIFGKKPLEEGVLKKYSVMYLGGHPDDPNKSHNVDLKIKEDGFYMTSDVNKKFVPMTVEYSAVKSVDIVPRTVSTVEGILGGLDSRQLNQNNNIHIAYIDEQGKDFTVRLEMITGVSVMGQAAKCNEFMDFLKVSDISGKFISEPHPANNAENDVLSQIEKLSKLHKSGVLTDEEFANKKAQLLEKV